MNEFENIDERLNAIRQLCNARWVAVEWQADAATWRRHVRGRDAMLPQTQARLFSDLAAISAAPAGAKEDAWKALLITWRASHGFWQFFRINGTIPATYAVLCDKVDGARLTLEDCREWIDISLRALIASAAEHERTQAGFERQQTVLESAASLLSAVAESDVIPRGLSLAARLVNADGAVYYELDADAGCLVSLFEQPASALAALQQVTNLDATICGIAARTGLAKSYKSGDPLDLLPTAGNASVSAAIAVPVAGHEGLEGVICVVRRSGGPFDELDANTLTLFTRQLAGVMENHRLLARLRTANRELSQTQAQLVESARLRTLGEMAAGVAHDFNNVLGALLGRVQLLQYRVSDASVLEGLTKIEKLIIEGEATVKRLQEAARVRKASDTQPATLDALMREVYSTTEHALHNQAQIYDRKISWNTEFKPAGPFTDVGGQLSAVLRQLLTELGETVPPETTIGLQTGRDDAAGCIRITLSLRAGGEWRWEQLDAFAGLRAAVAALNGIVVASTAVRGEAQLRVQFGGAEVTSPAPDAKPKKYRVLVIDDDDEVREVLEELLRIDGHQVTSAADGAQALNLFLPGKFDLVFTDLGMPGVSGWQVAESIKRAAPSVPVVMVTGWGAQLDPEKVRQSGIDRVLTKPFQWLAVLEALNELAGGRGQTQRSAR